jgi:hypothetical protein
MQTIDDEQYEKLVPHADEKYAGSVQKLIRYDIIPEWVNRNKVKK